MGASITQYINGAFIANASTYVTSFFFNGNLYYSPALFAAAYGLYIYQYPDPKCSLLVNLANLPPHFQMDFRFSVSMGSTVDSNLVCTSNNIELNWSGPSNFLFTLNNPKDVLNKSMGHSASS